MMRIAGLALAAVVIGAGAPAQTPAPPPVALDRLGPQVGDRVPDFTAIDQNGQPRTLRSILGPNGAMLIFFRSADW